ncbi:MAG TPA: hypothetical protein DCQ26_05535 [Marinilabiliales bacterium]|nr:MAG: hypothetical protein A2W84_16540 [Bacteroidetes bacterium GWC2_40_13]OFX73985.1 MAG: hypothetical protein A2W96_11765 [Bacteroidetes bacterium GWD2_40_43]OFX93181.1 MAG: hypothetical protein A2W97_06305 [Bacteroidetes bacterium GWE2_40_63]OFY21551.1 MAG: hypothetical protein A2W88_10305 [Bacteroidetes bacterium GWF2_40_13]OFZ24204.1 MAG: hypothetical protein A2437_17440 [Bacteroidetes bacterium RIFOXYC2_FULL_40_12]HAM98052.1 hypothetical protein [Marinilabiliales bacterium]
MITLEQALQIVLNKSTTQLATEKVSLHESPGRVLGEDVTSDMDMPPFDKAAMDGFAIRESEIEQELDVIETVAAGQSATKEVVPGTAIRIMTGAPIPKGADFVIQVELSEISCTQKVIFSGHPKNNIVYRASDVKKGDVVLHKGQFIDARHIAVLASVGCPQPVVYKQPKVGIISTGDEIVEPDIVPNASQIRNSNGHQLIAQIKQSGGLPIYYGIVKDDYFDTYHALKKGMEECDILLLTGGVSMGDFDFVPKIMADLGIEIQFDWVAVQPGKPTTFGTKGCKLIFGLPGNPVSSFIQFDVLVKPAIHNLMGISENRPSIQLPMGKNYSRKRAERKSYIPILINEKSQVIPTEYHGSAHIYSLPSCHGLAIIEIGIKELKEGDLVHVRLL